MFKKKLAIIPLFVVFITFVVFLLLNLNNVSIGLFLLIESNHKNQNKETNSALYFLQDLKAATPSDPSFCNISFNPPWFVVYNNDGGYLIVISSEGNLFINTTSNLEIISSVNQTSWLNAFILRNLSHILFAANRTRAQIYGGFVENVTPVPTRNSFIVRNRSNNVVLSIFNSSDGKFYLKGMAVYSGSQAGCPADYWYCDSTTTRRYRDYYCLGGICTYADSSSQDCYDNIACRGCTSARKLYCYRCYNGLCESICSTTELPDYSCTRICFD